MSSQALQGALFGGFKRKGVIAYIEKTAREHTAQLAGKDEELAALRQENERLREELSQMQTEAESLRSEAEEFRAIKEHLTELQMEAVRCAKEIERSARERAEKTETAAYARIRAVNRESKTRMDEGFAFVDDLLNATAAPEPSEQTE